MIKFSLCQYRHYFICFNVKLGLNVIVVIMFSVCLQKEDLAGQLSLVLTEMETEFRHCQVTVSPESGLSYICFQQSPTDDQVL